MSESKVIVTANKAGHVIVKSASNEAYGHIRVKQTRMVVDDTTGFAKQKEISALVPGEIKDLKGFGWSDKQEVNGKIRIVEKTVPFNKKDPDRDLKVAGDSGVVCTVDDDPIYRKHFFTLNEGLADDLIQHNNEDEIKAAYAASKGDAVVAAQGEDFDL